MTTLRRRSSVCATARRKGYFKALRARRRRKRPLSASLETPWTETGPNLAGGGRLVYTASWNWSVKTEIPDKTQIGALRRNPQIEIRISQRVNALP
jgi:hypothetical protein